MQVAAAIAGTLIICFMLYDVFHTIFNPRGTGSVGDLVAVVCWRMFRRFERFLPSSRPYAGPIAMLLILCIWTGSLIAGWS